MSGAFGLGALTSTALGLPESLLFNTADPIVLDTVVLDAFEIPERVTWGGTQKIVPHLLPGGERVFDVMGREEEPISWSGVFLGQQALERAVQFDTLRANGRTIQLSWGTLSYTVVVESFSADYRLRYHLPYKIALKVLRDNSAPLPNNTVTPEQAVSNDVGSGNAAMPADASPKAVVKVTAETKPPTTTTTTYQPIEQIAPTRANAVGTNAIDPFVAMVDTGPAAAVPVGSNAVTAAASAQTAADQALFTANAPLFTGQ